MESNETNTTSNKKSSPHVLILPLAVYYMFMALSSVMINITEYTIYNEYGYDAAMMFAFSMGIIWFIVFCGVSKESYKLIRLAFCLWTIFIICWIRIVILCMRDNNAGLYYVNRRYPGSFWITASTFNKLATENVFDYYNHQSHSWAEYDNRYDDQITEQYIEYLPTEKFIDALPVRTRLLWFSKDFIKHLIPLINFVVLFLFFGKSWLILKHIFFTLRKNLPVIISPC